MAGNVAGALKRRSIQAGVSVEVLLEHERRNEFWCYRCRTFHPRAEFGDDRARGDGRERCCKESRNLAARKRYKPHPINREIGKSWRKDPRDGDRKQARGRVNYLVRVGLIPDPDDLACADCSHVGPERRHEYDHYLGYGAEHHEDVQVVCTLCHRRRCDERGELVQKRGEDGRFVTKVVMIEGG